MKTSVSYSYVFVRCYTADGQDEFRVDFAALLKLDKIIVRSARTHQRNGTAEMKYCTLESTTVQKHHKQTILLNFSPANEWVPSYTRQWASSFHSSCSRFCTWMGNRQPANSAMILKMAMEEDPPCSNRHCIKAIIFIHPITTPPLWRRSVLDIPYLHQSVCVNVVCFIKLGACDYRVSTPLVKPLLWTHQLQSHWLI